jgi:hypothetical protein
MWYHTSPCSPDPYGAPWDDKHWTFASLTTFSLTDTAASASAILLQQTLDVGRQHAMMEGGGGGKVDDIRMLHSLHSVSNR